MKVRCKHCKRSVSDVESDDEYFRCPKCGQEHNICQGIKKKTKNEKCHALVRHDENFCSKCGNQIRAAESASGSESSSDSEDEADVSGRKEEQHVTESPYSANPETEDASTMSSIEIINEPIADLTLSQPADTKEQPEDSDDRKRERQEDDGSDVKEKEEQALEAPQKAARNVEVDAGSSAPLPPGEASVVVEEDQLDDLVRELIDETIGIELQEVCDTSHQEAEEVPPAVATADGNSFLCLLESDPLTDG